MSALPALLPVAGPLVRLWDGDWNLRAVLNPDEVTKTDDGWSFVYPLDNAVCQWLLEITTEHRPAFMTVERDGGRRFARLTDWTIRKNGPCPHCAHCQMKVLQAHWEQIED